MAPADCIVVMFLQMRTSAPPNSPAPPNPEWAILPPSWRDRPSRWLIVQMTLFAAHQIA
jgi:hypothetical protein